ncbi:hypothetical protein CLV47_10411 [Antricoccus suffuscus]|uniref:Uncharacterized protein n=1 Tax=Antricoccus suffuscus TaxID=1629062 RepID=A0A2T1A2E6_9ACTN|nr:hypothetical protein [Antricoccus suffuscus]PRZ42667.1 hypothetical protein CLV47_10411 [Antricoccus suffuscus]
MTNVTTSLAHDRKQSAAAAPTDTPHSSEAPPDAASASGAGQSDVEQPGNEQSGDARSEQPVDIEDTQSTVNAICGRRYKLNGTLRDAANCANQPGWHAFHARDEFLGRSVVVRLAAARTTAEVAAVSKLVDRARGMASVNEHLISRTYDAVVQDSDTALSATDQQSTGRGLTHALIVSSYFEGPTLEELIADDAQVDPDALLDSLHGRLGALAEAGLSLGVLRPDQIVMTEDGPAIAAPAIGSVDEIGPTDLTGVCDSLGVDPAEIARAQASATVDVDAKGTMRESELHDSELSDSELRETGQGDPADTGPLARFSDDDSPLSDDFYDDPGDDGNNGNGGGMGNGQDEPKRNKFVLAVAVLLSLCALLVIGWFVGLLIGGVFHSDSNKSTAAKTPASSSSAPPVSQAKPQAGQPIAVAGAKLLDPPPGDGKENPDRLNLSYDGNTGTTWPTLQYKGSANFGNLKPGVGIVYDLGSEQTLGAVKITTTLPGATVEIRTGTEPQASSLDAYPVVVPDTKLNGETEIKLPEGTKTRYVVVWITKLVPQESYYQASLSEVAFTS